MRNSALDDKDSVLRLDRLFKPYAGPSAKISGESNSKRVAKRNAFKRRFLAFAQTDSGKASKLFAVTFTYPPSAAEDSLYADMQAFAKRIARRPGDYLWVVASEAVPRQPRAVGQFHWHGIAVIHSGKRDQEWLKEQWASRVGANRSAIDAQFLWWSDRRGQRFRDSAVRWINYCCRSPPPSFPLPLKRRVVASGDLAAMWTRATGYRPVVDGDFEPHTWIRSRVGSGQASGTSRHGLCHCKCGLEIPNEKRLGSKFFDEKHKDAFHAATRKTERRKNAMVQRRAAPPP